MPSRGRIENDDLGYSVRVNGRITAAFRKFDDAREFAARLIKTKSHLTIDIYDREEVCLSLSGAAAP